MLCDSCSPVVESPRRTPYIINTSGTCPPKYTSCHLVSKTDLKVDGVFAKYIPLTYLTWSVVLCSHAHIYNSRYTPGARVRPAAACDHPHKPSREDKSLTVPQTQTWMEFLCCDVTSLVLNLYYCVSV